MKIYWKIFAGFWLATFLMVSLALVVSNLAGTPDRRRPPPAPHLLRQIDKVVRQQGVEGLRVWLAEQDALDQNSLFIVDTMGNAVYPATIPAKVQGIFQQQFAVGRRQVFHRLDGAYIKRRLTGPRGEEWRVVVRLPPPWMQQFHERPMLRYVTALVVSGLVCYLLTMLLTRRINRLGETVRQLADGQLDARADWAGSSRRGDEIQRLAVDFNHMAQRLQQLLASQEQLIKGISHELRSPLARMHVLLELARQRAGTAGGTELNRLEREIERLENIISDLLLLPRLEQHPELADEIIDLPALLRVLVEDCATEAGRGQNPIRLQCAAGDILVRGRASLLRSVFENVLSNGIRHSPAGAAVELELFDRGEQLEVAVRDYGEGLQESQLGRIFEPFFRVSGARDRDSGGVGLGLAIAQRVVLAHGGEIVAENAGPGLRLRILLPRARV